MRKAILLITVLSLFLIATLVCLKRSTPMLAKPLLDSGTKKGVYIGTKASGLEPVSDKASGFSKTVQALNEGWDNVGIGNSFYRAGQYEEAARAYKRAYDVDPGNRVFTGLKLIDTYERLSLYGDALLVLGELSTTQPISDYGVKKYDFIRGRLLAAKAKQEATA